MNKYLLIASVAIFGFMACGDDEEMGCELPAADVNIIGQWSPTTSEEVVEFKSGGELIDDNDAILGLGDDPEMKTYEFISGFDSLKVSTSSNVGSISSTFKFTNEDCDVIKLGIIGINLEFRRVN